MTNLMTFAIPISLGAVLVVLSLGLFGLFRGSDKDRSRSNKLMRLRVLLQFIAVLVLLGALWLSQNIGG